MVALSQPNDSAVTALARVAAPELELFCASSCN